MGCVDMYTLVITLPSSSCKCDYWERPHKVYWISWDCLTVILVQDFI